MPMPSAEISRLGRGLLLASFLVLTACGGGGGGGTPVAGGNAGPTGNTGATPPSTPSSGGSPAAAPIASGVNVVPLVVDAGPPGVARIANVPYATVTVCPPGSNARCQTIDHVLVDTGSSGLRLFASALADPGALPAVANGAAVPYAQCATFIGGYTWGSVRSADVVLGGLTAPALPIQVMADPAYPAVPAACARTGSSQNSVALLGANGILGVGVFAQDCGSTCVGAAIAATYYTCTAGAAGSNGSCTPTAVPLAQQVAQPIGRLPSDNNGSVILFPAVAGGGQATVDGALVLGIGTRANNATGSATAYPVNPDTGNLTVTYNGRAYSRAAFDSGSNFYFFNDPTLPTCSSADATGRTGYYCPATTLTLSALVAATNAASTTVSFRVANATNMFNNTNAVIPDVASTIGSNNVFLFGLPFFYGRSVFTALQGQATPLGTGPYVGF
ncbi:DUF3443 family protein [Xylophilus sp. Kf1]|nr:DUF3443 family protein [Xylophilus sp. Kf1]